MDKVTQRGTALRLELASGPLTLKPLKHNLGASNVPFHVDLTQLPAARRG